MKKNGFTLIEVLIVGAIIGLLATLVVPRFFSQNERGIATEAVAMLSALRQAEAAYNLENGAYTNVLGDLDIDVTPSTKFTFVCNLAGLCAATRSVGGTTFDGKTIRLDQAGAWTGTHPYVPND